MNKRAVLLANLGSPDAPEVPEVRRYLKQFLMDPYVIQQSWLLRAMIVNLFVLPTRPKYSAEAYRAVWTDDGSPLVALSHKLIDSLKEKVDLPLAVSMRYGKPSIESELSKLAAIDGIEEILFVPLYPHCADSTITTSIKEAERVIRDKKLKVKLLIHKPFYEDETYIKALVNSARSTLEKDFDHILFSYHGLPESHLTAADPTGKHCLKSADCCSKASEAHASCYRHQVIRTTERFAEESGLRPEQYTIAYQSRLGRQKWLEPSTEDTLSKLAKEGIKKLAVICPAFVTDCLETLEEIDIQGRETFLEAGGQELIYIPCLNDNEDWVNCLAQWVQN